MDAEIAYDADFYIKGLVACSATAWFIYEIVITLGEEIEYIWRSTWSLPKALYLIARYFGLITLLLYTSGAIFSFATLSLEACAIYDDVVLLSVMIVATVVDGLLLLRVMALYSLRPRLRLVLKILYVLGNCVQYILLILSIVQTALQLHSESPDAAGCVSWMNTDPLMIMAGLLPSLLFNVVLFLFIAHALLPFWKRSSRTPLFELFFRDGALYVFIVAGTEFLMIITTIAFRDRPGIMLVTAAWLISVLPIASCRLMLNLRGLLGAPRTDVTTEPSAIDIRRSRYTQDTGFTSERDIVVLEELESTGP